MSLVHRKCAGFWRAAPAALVAAPLCDRDWNEIAGAIEDAYAEVAPKRLVERALAARDR
jgi:hypothetical protein